MSLIGAYATVFVQVIINTLWQGIIVGGGLWLLIRILPKTSAATRHAVLFIGLLTIGALPFISIVSALNAEPININKQADITFDDPEYFTEEELLSPVEKQVTETIAQSNISNQLVTISSEEFQSSGLGGGIIGYRPNSEPFSQPAVTEQSSVLSTVQKTRSDEMNRDGVKDDSYRVLATIILLIWASIFIVMSGRTFRSYLAVRRICKMSGYALDQYQFVVDKLADSMGIKRSVRALVTQSISMPMTVGTMHPVILLPPCVFDLLSELEFKSVIMHELAHIKRFDYLFNFTHRIIQSYLFFHPAVFLLGRQLSVEREHACDDWAVKVCEPRRYAGSLARLIEYMNESKWIAHASVGSTSLMMMLGKHVITRRVEMILDHKRNSTVKVSRYAVVSAFGTAALVIVLSILFTPALALPSFTGQNAEHDCDKDIQDCPNIHKAPKAPKMPDAPKGPIGLNAPSLPDAPEEPFPPIPPGPAKGIQFPLPPSPPTPVMLKSVELDLPSLALALAPQPFRLAAFQDQARDQSKLKSTFVFPDMNVDFDWNIIQDKDGKPRPPILSDKELLSLLTDVAKNDADESVRKEAMATICRLQSDEAVDAMIDIYDRLPDVNTKMAAIRAFSRSQNKKAADKLVSIAKNDSDPKLRQTAIRYLSGHRGTYYIDVKRNISGVNKTFRLNMFDKNWKTYSKTHEEFMKDHKAKEGEFRKKHEEKMKEKKEKNK